MKDKILMLIIGVLLGAVITAGCFLIFNKQKGPEGSMPQRGDMENMVPGEFGEGRRGSGQNSTTTNANTQTDLDNEV